MTDMDKYFIRLGIAIFLFSTLWLHGCATTQIIQDTQSGMTLSEAIRSVTLGDLDAAMADATAHGDQIAMACYPVLRKYVEGGLGIPGQGSVKGPISAAQAARDQIGQVKTGVPDDLKLACAALVQDSRDFILKMSALVGSKGQFGGL